MRDLVAVGYDDRPGGPPLQKAKGRVAQRLRGMTPWNRPGNRWSPTGSASNHAHGKENRPCPAQSCCSRRFC